MKKGWFFPGCLVILTRFHRTQRAASSGSDTACRESLAGPSLRNRSFSNGLLSMNRAFLFSWLLLLSVFSRAQADSTVSFNEIMYHPATNEPAMEWIELRNQQAVDVDISGWSITGGINYSFASNTIVRGNGYLVLASSPTT